MRGRERSQFIEVHQASSEISADLIRMRLEEEEIPCVILGDDTAGLFGQAMRSRVMVPRGIAEARAAEIRQYIAGIEAGAEPTPRAPYLVALPRGFLITLALVVAAMLATGSVGWLIAGSGWGRLGAGVGLAVSVLFAWVGGAALLRDRKRRSERASDEDQA